MSVILSSAHHQQVRSKNKPKQDDQPSSLPSSYFNIGVQQQLQARAPKQSATQRNEVQDRRSLDYTDQGGGGKKAKIQQLIKKKPSGVNLDDEMNVKDLKISQSQQNLNAAPPFTIPVSQVPSESQRVLGTSPSTLVASLLNMLPSFSQHPAQSQQPPERQLTQLIQTLDSRLKMLEKRYSQDVHFHNERIQSLETEFSQRVSSLEVEVSQLKTELKAKDEYFKNLSAVKLLQGATTPDSSVPSLTQTSCEDDDENAGTIKIVDQKVQLFGGSKRTQQRGLNIRQHMAKSVERIPLGSKVRSYHVKTKSLCQIEERLSSRLYQNSNNTVDDRSFQPQKTWEQQVMMIGTADNARSFEVPKIGVIHAYDDMQQSQRSQEGQEQHLLYAISEQSLDEEMQRLASHRSQGMQARNRVTTNISADNRIVYEDIDNMLQNESPRTQNDQSSSTQNDNKSK